MSKKFSRLLMTGKAATLPLLMNQAQALQSWTPTWSNVITTDVSQVQIPVDRAVELGSLGTPVYDGAATVCSVNGSVTDKLGVVLTGLNDRDVVYVLTATSTGGNEHFHPGIKVGTQNLMIPKSLNVFAGGAESVSATVAIELSKLAAQGYALSSGSRFYMQTIVFPAASYQNGSIDWNLARVSEMDVVSISACSYYGPHGQIVY